jgi:NAD(P)-dependent dehydrogenase (short-subunit alcohol dehydrogenase family)
MANKTVVITGTATGIGNACAKKFAKMDYQVVALDINIHDC